MEFIVKNWYMILAAVVLLAAIAYTLIRFFQQPSGE